MDYTVHGILQARILEWVSLPFSRGYSQARSPTLQADFLPAETQGKPKNTGVDSLSLRQQIFPTQKSSRGLLHCRRLLYQLSYQGSLCLTLPTSKMGPLTGPGFEVLAWDTQESMNHNLQLVILRV